MDDKATIDEKEEFDQTVNGLVGSEHMMSSSSSHDDDESFSESNNHNKRRRRRTFDQFMNTDDSLSSDDNDDDLYDDDDAYWDTMSDDDDDDVDARSKSRVKRHKFDNDDFRMKKKRRFLSHNGYDEPPIMVQKNPIKLNNNDTMDNVDGYGSEETVDHRHFDDSEMNDESYDENDRYDRRPSRTQVDNDRLEETNRTNVKKWANNDSAGTSSMMDSSSHRSNTRGRANRHLRSINHAKNDQYDAQPRDKRNPSLNREPITLSGADFSITVSQGPQPASSQLPVSPSRSTHRMRRRKSKQSPIIDDEEQPNDSSNRSLISKLGLELVRIILVALSVAVLLIGVSRLHTHEKERVEQISTSNDGQVNSTLISSSRNSNKNVSDLIPLLLKKNTDPILPVRENTTEIFEQLLRAHGILGVKDEMELLRNQIEGQTKVYTQLQQHLTQLFQNQKELNDYIRKNDAANQPLLETDVQKMIDHSLNIYSADRISKVDFAQKGLGSLVVSHSPSYDCLHCNWRTFPTNVHRYLFQKFTSPDILLDPDVTLGKCWAMRGQSGYVTIKLPYKIIPNGFSIEHVSQSVTPDISSAPKNITVYVHRSEEQQEKIAEYIYDREREGVQTFPLIQAYQGTLESFQFYTLRVNDNYGNQNFTCLYRFRIHGKKPE